MSGSASCAQAREAAKGDADALKVIQRVEAMGEHAWRKGMSQEERAKIDRFYKERYGAGPPATP